MKAPSAASPRRLHSGVTMWAGPLDSRQAGWLRAAELWPPALVLLAAAVPRVAWWALNLPPGLDRDSGSYVVPAYDLVTAGTFDNDPRHSPGYPLFLAAVLGTFGPRSLIPVLVIQHLLVWLGAGLTYLLARLLFGRPTAVLAGLLVGLDGALLLFSHTLMTEVLWAFCLLLACCLLVLGMKSGRPLWFLGVGLALGLLALIRPAGQALLLPPLALCLLAPWRRRLRSSLLLLAGFGLLVGPPLLANWAQHRTLNLVSSSRYLVHRVLRDDDLFIRWAASGRTPDDPLRRAAFEIMLEEDRADRPDPVALRLRRELNLDDAQAEQLMQELALGAILASPLHFAQSSALLSLQIVINRPLELSTFWWDYDDLNWPRRAASLFPRQDQERYLQAQLLASLVDPGRVGPLLLVLFAAGAVAAWPRPSRRLWLVPAAMLTLGVLLTGAFGGIEWRFRFGFDPLLLLGAAAGVVLPLSALLSKARRPRERRKDRSLVWQPEQHPLGGR